MNFYLDPIPLVFGTGCLFGWISLIGLVYGLATVQRRRNRRPQ